MGITIPVNLCNFHDFLEKKCYDILGRSIKPCMVDLSKGELETFQDDTDFENSF